MSETVFRRQSERRNRASRLGIDPFAGPRRRPYVRPKMELFAISDIVKGGSGGHADAFVGAVKP
jgi:hypothetical protein